jgi:hypothetical protein
MDRPSSTTTPSRRSEDPFSRNPNSTIDRASRALLGTATYTPRTPLMRTTCKGTTGIAPDNLSTHTYISPVSSIISISHPNIRITQF